MSGPTRADVQRLLDAGFTVDEMRHVAETLQFMATLAEAGEIGAHAHIHLSAEKMATLLEWSKSLRNEPS
jgi:hypothetical protein